MTQPTHPAPAKTPHLNADSIPMEAAEALLPEEATLDGQPLFAKDPHFQSELEYDGYTTIEKYDNDEYAAAEAAEVDGEPGKDLVLQDREEDDSIRTEESVIDKQEHQKN